eukprot:g11700.t1
MALVPSSSLMTLGRQGDRGMARHNSVPSLTPQPTEFKFGRPDYAIKGTESQLKPIKDKVRAAVKKRRLRLEEFFQPFDVTRTKKVTETTFVRAMNASGIGLTKEELGLLINRYRIPAGNGLIDYQKFCDQSNKVFTLKHLERTPGKKLVRCLREPPPNILGAGNPLLTPTEKLRTVDMLEEMRRNVRDTSLIVKNLFNQFDLHGRGCVSAEQFLRVISCHGLLSANKVLDMERYGHVLVKAFTESVDGPGLEAIVVNYKELHKQLMTQDFWENNVVEPKPALLIDSHPEAYNISNGDESEAERLERLLVEEAVARRIEVIDYLTAAVGGGSAGTKHPGSESGGLCSRDRFKQALRGLWRTHFTDEQAEALADQYRPSVNHSSARMKGLVDLATFARRLGTRVLAAKKRAEKAEGAGTRPGGGGVVAPPRLSDKEARDVENVILDMRGRIKRQRITLKPSFKNFDPRNELVVANEQFARVLSAQGLLPTDSRLRELLIRRYAVSDFRRQTTVHQGFVAYLEFLQDVDAPLEVETQAYIDNFVFNRDQNQPTDPPNKKPEKSDGVRRSTTNGGGGILRSAASLTSEALMGRGGVGFNPARDCDAVIRDVRRRTARERVRITDLFQDFDSHQHGTCTQAQLARVMKTLDHALSDKELEAVCRRYQSKVPSECSPGDGTPLINYKNLVSDIEAVFTVEELEKKSATTNVEQSVREARGVERRLRGESSRLEELTQEEERMVAKFLRELAMKVNTESLCLSSLFTDYDHFNAGDITEAGMERALGGACLLPPEPIFRAIVKKFREHSRHSSGGEVELAQDPLATPRDLPNATKFRAMRAEGGAQSMVVTPASSSPSQGGGTLTPRRCRRALRSALRSIGDQLSCSHCQLEDFLAHEDTLKTGEVTRTAMRHSLVLAGVRLTSLELSAVDQSFRSATRPEMIGWKDICRAAVEAYSGGGFGSSSGSGNIDGGSTVGPVAARVGGSGRDTGSGGASTRSPSSWKEEELLLKIGGEIKTRNPNLEVMDAVGRGGLRDGQGARTASSYRRNALSKRPLAPGESPHRDRVARQGTVVAARGQACTMQQQKLDGSFVIIETGHAQGRSAHFENLFPVGLQQRRVTEWREDAMQAGVHSRKEEPQDTPPRARNKAGGQFS